MHETKILWKLFILYHANFLFYTKMKAGPTERNGRFYMSGSVDARRAML